MVTGSVAMAIYSIPRMTRDIDLVVEMTSADIDRIMHLFSEGCCMKNPASMPNS